MGDMGGMIGAVGNSKGFAGGNQFTSADMFGLLQNYAIYKMQQSDQEKAWEDQLEKQYEMQKQFLQEMFPLTGVIQDLGMQLYGEHGDELLNYLLHPTPVSNLERQLFEFFGGTQEGKGARLYRKYGAKQSGPLAGLGPEMLSEATGLLQSLIPYGQDLGRTGFRTDIGPAQDYALRLLEREMVPELAERFGGSITGSGFQNALLGTAGDVASELGSLQVMLDEAAANRRLQGLQSGTVQNLFTGPLNLNTAFASAAAQAGQNYRNAVNQARPGYGMLAAMPSFVNAATSGGFIQPGFPTSGTDYGNLMSGLGQVGTGVASGIGNLLSGLFQGQGSGGGGWQGTGYSNFDEWLNKGSNLMNSPTTANVKGQQLSSVGEMGSWFA